MFEFPLQHSVAYYQERIFDKLTAFFADDITIPDGQLDGVYVTETDDGYLCFNWRNQTVDIKLHKRNVGVEKVSLEAEAISHFPP